MPTKIRIVVTIDTTECSPRELRQRLVESFREAILRARSQRRIDTPITEEFLRAIPTKDRV